MIAGQLEIQMMANMARLQQDMNQAKNTVGRTMGGINSAVGGAMKILGALGVGLSVNYFGRMIQGAIDSQDALAKMSQKINVSVTNLAGLDHAAQLSGTTLIAVEKALKTVSAQLFDADKGLAESIRNFSSLGINIHEVTGELKDADAVMIETADAFAAMEDGSKKTALAVKLFGKSGLDLIPMLNDGSAALAEMVAEGKRLNPVTEESARQAELYNDNILRLKGSISALGTVLVNQLLPSLSSLSDEMVEFSRSGELEKWGERAIVVLEFLATVIAIKLTIAIINTGLAFLAATGQLTAYQAALALLGGPIGAVTLLLGGLAVAYYNVRIAQERARQGAMDWIAGQDGIEGIDLTITGTLRDLEKINAEIEAIRKDGIEPGTGDANMQLLEQTELVERLNELAKRRIALQGQLKTETAETVIVDKTWEQILADLNDEASDLYKSNSKLTESIYKETGAVEEQIRAQRDQIALTQRTEREQFILNETMKLGTGATLQQVAASMALASIRYDQIQAAEAATEAERELARASEKADADRIRTSEQAAAAIRRDWERTRDVFSDAFVDMAFDGENAFDAIADSFKRMIVTMLADWAAAKIMDFTGITGFIGSGGTQSSLFGGTGGTTTGGASLAVALDPATMLTMASTMVSSMAGSVGFGSLSTTGGWVSNSMANPSTLAGTNPNAANFQTSPTLTSSLINTGITMVAGFAGSWAGNKAGEAVFNKKAESAIGATVGSFVGSIWGPLGTAIGGAIGGMLDVATGGDGYIRSSAGFLTAPTPGAAGNTFDVPAFASGFKPIGFADKQDREIAIAQIDLFRGIDQALVDLANAAGGFVDMSKATLAGVNGDGQAGTSGTFIGVGGKTTPADLEQMAFLYAQQLAKHIEGISPETVAQLAGARTMSDISEALKLAADGNAALIDPLKDLIDPLEALTKGVEALSLDELFGAGSATAKIFGSATGGANLTQDQQNDRMRGIATTRRDLQELLGNMASIGLGNVAPGPAGIDLDISRMLLDIYNSGDLGRANSFALNNPSIATAVGFSADGSHADGLNYVPFDNYQGILHRGERVQSESQARDSDGATTEIQKLNQNFEILLYTVQNLAVSSNKTARALDEAIRTGSGSLAVVVT